MTNEWVPFGESAAVADQYRVLVDGVPRRLREPLVEWMQHLLRGEHDEVRNSRTHELEIRTDLPIGLAHDSFIRWGRYAQVLRDLDQHDLLKVIDAALSFEWYRTRTSALEDLLRSARSKWTVGERMGSPGLVSRGPEGVQDTVEATIAASGTAGQILARAWGKVHALTPDDSGAYADAVRAVEAVAQPLVEPDNKEATLGGIASVMRTQGNWRLPLREHPHAPTSELLVAMLRSLYRGHADRHGNDDYRDVSHEEARAGVILAATLVSWFSAGEVQQRDAHV